MLCESDIRDYQHRLIKHIKDKPNCALWVDMGLGKTVATLTALNSLRESFDVNRTLIVGPLRVARKVWDDEISEWEHLEGITTSHILGSREQRLRGMRTDAQFHMINRENLTWLVDQHIRGTGKKAKLIRKWPWDTVVLDESSSFKSQSSKRWKAIRKCRQLFDRCIQLTGTPIPNGYGDLWSQINILDRGERLGYSEKAFRNRWMQPPSQYDPGSKWEMRAGAAQEIQQLVRDIVVSMKAEDYLDLPEVMNNAVRVSMTGHQQEQYDEMAREFCLEVQGHTVTAVNAGVLAGKLLQLANGAMYTGAGKHAYVEIHKAKTEALIEILDQTQGPALVGYNFKSDVPRTMGALTRWARQNKKVLRILNSTKDEDDWNDNKVDIMLMHPGSAGHGLNLHKSDSETIIWYGLNWSLELYQQMNARLAGGHRRIGKNMVIHHIICEGTIDERVIGRISQKGATQDELTKAISAYTREILNS